MPQARTACVGRRSTLKGHRGSNHSDSRCVSEYPLNELAAQAITAIETARVATVIPTRIHCQYLEYFRYLAARISSVVYAGGSRLAFRWEEENDMGCLLSLCAADLGVISWKDIVAVTLWSSRANLEIGMTPNVKECEETDLSREMTVCLSGN